MGIKMINSRTGVFKTPGGEFLLERVLVREFGAITDTHVHECCVHFKQWHAGNPPSARAFVQAYNKAVTKANLDLKCDTAAGVEFAAMDAIRDAFYSLALQKHHRTRSRSNAKASSVVSESTNVGSTFSRATFVRNSLFSANLRLNG